MFCQIYQVVTCFQHALSMKASFGLSQFALEGPSVEVWSLFLFHGLPPSVDVCLTLQLSCTTSQLVVSYEMSKVGVLPDPKNIKC
jgi:hypothetical protein